jgi:hypothetical protein
VYHLLNMAAVCGVRQKQPAIIMFWCENKMVGNIHNQLQEVYVENTVDHSTVSYWVQRTSGEGGHAGICCSMYGGSRG